MEKNEKSKPADSGSLMSSEPAAIYYGTSEQLRESGILSQIMKFDADDTVWLIRFMQQHLDRLRASDVVPVINPLETLDSLGAMIKSTGKTSEQLIAEHVNEKYGL